MLNTIMSTYAILIFFGVQNTFLSALGPKVTILVWRSYDVELAHSWGLWGREEVDFVREFAMGGTLTSQANPSSLKNRIIYSIHYFHPDKKYTNGINKSTF